MKDKTLVKTKIVLECDGESLTTYFWKKTFWVFGYWYPFGTCRQFSKLPNDRIAIINDDSVSKLLFDNFISY